MRKFLRPFIVIAAVAAMAGLSHPVFAQTSEEITSFASQIEVRADGTIAVAETIEYFFPSPRHGIYRDVPTRYEDENGKQWVIPIDVSSVRSGSGGSVRFEVSSTEYGTRIKIGDPGRTVSGSQTYVISYDARGALRYFEDHDELYWNVTGTEWTVPIRRSSAVIRLPEVVPTEGLRTECYTGPRGSTARDCVANVQGTAANFAANDMMTVVFGWKPGLVAKLLPEDAPTADGQGIPRFLTSSFFRSPFFLLQLLVPVIAFAFMFSRWRKYGRDLPGRGTLMAEYDPPDDASPAEIGTLIDETAGAKEVSATIVDLAVRGYLKIAEIEKKGILFTSKDHSFTRLKPYAGDAALKPYEQDIMAVLFGSGEVSVLSHLKETYAFKDRLKPIESKMFEQVTSMGYYELNPQKARSKYLVAAAVIALVAFFGPGSLLGIALVPTALIVAIFGYFMSKKTPKGVEALDHAKGFREYLSKAETYRIQWQEKEGIFEKFLPYAMAFGIVDKWAKAFEGMQLAQPTWYEGSAFRAGAFNAVAFHSAFSSFGNAMNSAVMSSPSKSSGGSGFGGGSSGGGGGGGGGGSW